MKKDTIINIINRIIWSEEKEKRKYKIEILDRLIPDTTKIVSGDSIKQITRMGGIELEDGTVIPVHRVKRIRYNNTIILDRK